MDLLVPALSAVLGLLFGSFANVAIARVPAGGSVVRPPSACPACAAPIRPRDNVPLLSWLLLRGRCRDCGTAISVRYPLVELSCALLFAAVGARVGASWALPGLLLFTWTLLVVAVIDADTRRIPNRLTYPLTPVLLGLLTLAAVLDGEPAAALRALAGGAAVFAVLLLLALASRGGLGMGDVKLGGFIGVGLGYLGWSSVVVGVFAAFLLGGLVALALVGLRLRGRRDLLPFGPYLAAGAVVGLLAGGPLARAYLTSLGLD